MEYDNELSSYVPEPKTAKNGNTVDFTGDSMCQKGKPCELTSQAYNLLQTAQKIASEKGYSIQVNSDYRSVEQQKEEWQKWASKIKNETKRREYVCYPFGDDVVKRCPHLSGNAVDVSLQGKQMTLQEWKTLEEIMLKAGWVRYSKERWHFECCDTPRYARAKEQGVGVVA